MAYPAVRMVSFTLEGIDRDDWEAFKNSYPRSLSIEEVLKRIIGGEHLQRTTDENGELSLGPEYADKELRVVVIDDEN